jgi:hypothetical protein
MGVFAKAHNFEKVAEDSQYYKEEAEMLKYKQESEERKAIIQKLKGMHGKNWKSILGLGGNPDTSTLRSLLSGFKTNSMKIHSGTGNTAQNLSPLPNGRPQMPTINLPKY